MRRVHRAAIVAALGLPLLLAMPGTAMAHRADINFIYQPIYIMSGNDSDTELAMSNSVDDD